MSDNVVIQPAPGQAILTSSSREHDHRGHGHEHSGHPDRWDLSAQMQRDAYALTNEISRGFTAGALASCKTDDGVQAVGATVRKDICELGSQVASVAKDSAIGFKDGLVTAYQVESRGLLEAAKNANALAVQADKNFYALSVENVKNASAAQLEAQKNASAIAAQVAECCCELKGAIAAEGVATRGLIETNEKARMAAVIVELQARLLRTPPLPT